jgi:hypothetical protein
MKRYSYVDNKNIEQLINSPSYAIYKHEVYLENSKNFGERQKETNSINKLRRRLKRKYVLIAEINSEGIQKNDGNTIIKFNKVVGATGYKIYI